MKRPQPPEKNTEAIQPVAASDAEQQTMTEAEQAQTPCDTSSSSELKTAKQEAEKYKDLALRYQAELDNYRKRIVREKEDSIRYANTAFLERLLPIVDSFELGLQATKNASDTSSILLGMNMVHKQLIEFLKDNGIQAIEAEGGPFDPNLHDAVSQECSEGVQGGHVIRQIRRGYKFKDRLLRPSSVVVSKGAGNHEE